jgi:hypothetical protein
MANDRYTKIVLTVIAVSLVAIAVQNLLPAAQAQAPACGLNKQNPCWVANTAESALFVLGTPRGLPVVVTNPSQQPIWVESGRR